MRPTGRRGKWLITCLMCCLVSLGILWTGQPAKASDPSTRVLTTGYRVDVERYRGGDVLGHGRGHTLSATSSPATTTTTDVSSTGVHTINFVNMGSSLVLISLNGSTVSTANSFPLPSGLSFLSQTKSPVSTIGYYCPTGTATLYVAW